MPRLHRYTQPSFSPASVSIMTQPLTTGARGVFPQGSCFLLCTGSTLFINERIIQYFGFSFIVRYAALGSCLLHATQSLLRGQSYSVLHGFSKVLSAAGDNCFTNTDGLIFPTALVQEGTTLSPIHKRAIVIKSDLHKRDLLIWATVSE